MPDGCHSPINAERSKIFTSLKICFCIDPVSKTFLKVYWTSFSLNPHVKKARDDSGGVSWTVFSSRTRMQFSSLSLFEGRTRQKTDTSSALLLSEELEVVGKEGQVKARLELMKIWGKIWWEYARALSNDCHHVRYEQIRIKALITRYSCCGQESALFIKMFRIRNLFWPRLGWLQQETWIFCNFLRT